MLYLRPYYYVISNIINILYQLFNISYLTFTSIIHSNTYICKVSIPIQTSRYPGFPMPFPPFFCCERFEFDVDKINFGTVSFGFLNSRTPPWRGWRDSVELTPRGENHGKIHPKGVRTPRKLFFRICERSWKFVWLLFGHCFFGKDMKHDETI